MAQWPPSEILKISQHSVFCVVMAASALACAPREIVPPPEDAVRLYVDALERRDAAALHGMMTEAARQEFSTEEVSALLERDELEFKERREALSTPVPEAQGLAQVFLSEGRVVEMDLERGSFWVRSAGLVPAQPKSPEEAARLLQQAVSARDFAKIAAALTPESARDFERAFQRLDASLEQLQTAVVDVREDRATIEFLDGREISLRRIDGIWRVEEFE